MHNLLNDIIRIIFNHPNSNNEKDEQQLYEWIDSLLFTFREEEEGRAEILYILHYTLEHSLNDYTELVLDTMTISELWDMNEHISAMDGCSIEDRQRSMIISSLILRLVSELPLQDVHLQRILYPVLVKAGETNTPLLSSTALACIETISKPFGSIQRLLSQNADYLLNVLSHQLTYEPADLHAPDMLIVLMKEFLHYSMTTNDQELGILIESISKDVLSALDMYPDDHRHVHKYLQVLYGMVSIWSDSDSQSRSDSDSGTLCNIDGTLCSDSGMKNQTENGYKGEKEFVYDYTPVSFRDKYVPLVDEEMAHLSQDNDENKYEEDDEEEDDQKKTTNIPQNIAQSILAKIKHFLLYPDTRIISLKVICRCIPLIEETTVLLPLIAQLWTPLCSNLFPLDIQTLPHLLDALECMHIHATQFLSRRLSSHTLPQLSRTLSSLYASSTDRSSYHYKLQLRLLRFIETWSRHITGQCSGVDIYTLVNSLRPYIVLMQQRKNGNDKQLYQIVNGIVLNCAHYDLDCTWYSLSILLSSMRNSNNSFANNTKFIEKTMEYLYKEVPEQPIEWMGYSL